MIRLYKVSKRYPDSGGSALSNINIEIPRGAMGFVIGHSGAGKSTLLKLLAGIEKPSGGDIHVAGSDLAQITHAELPAFRRRIGVVFQDNRLLFDRSVGENVALPLEVCNVRSEDIDRRVRAALDKVGLSKHIGSMPQQLSGGEQQRVSIARAVVNRPEIIIADEPTGNLDRKLAQDIMRLFWEFNRVGVTVLVATHDTDMVEQMEMPVLELQNGKVLHNEFYEAAPV
ncbi:MAG: cell division ATP-binding protein FtsE [Granulosicoccaceae bacterium]